MGRGGRRMARKFSLRSGGGRRRLHNKLSGTFGTLVKIWHPSEIYVTFSSKVLMTMVFLRTNFSSFTTQTPRKTQISLMAAINRSTSMRWTTASVWQSFVFYENDVPVLLDALLLPQSFTCHHGIICGRIEELSDF